jgi:hypothetical protein
MERSLKEIERKYSPHPICSSLSLSLSQVVFFVSMYILQYLCTKHEREFIFSPLQKKAKTRVAAFSVNA